jgi:hypothetical protein
LVQQGNASACLRRAPDFACGIDYELELAPLLVHG